MLQNSKITGFADEISDSLELQARLLKSLGIKYLEFRSAEGKNVADYTAEEIKGVKRFLDREELQVSAVGSPVGKISIEDAFEAHFESYKRIVETAHILETPFIRMFSFYLPDSSKAQNYKAEVIDRLGRLKDYAKGEEIILLHENEKGIYGDTALRCLDILKALSDEHFRAIFDFANFVQCQEDTLKAYELLKPYISYIHIKDALKETGEVRPAGEGDGKVKEILTSLDSSGYSGFLSLEPHLADFTMFAQLEEAEGRFQLTNNEQAFMLAHKALLKILNQ